MKATGAVGESALRVPLAHGSLLHLSRHGDQIFVLSRHLCSNDPDRRTFKMWFACITERITNRQNDKKQGEIF